MVRGEVLIHIVIYMNLQNIVYLTKITSHREITWGELSVPNVENRQKHKTTELIVVSL